MKFDLKKEPSFKAGKRPVILNRPQMQCLVINGEGDPNAIDFQSHIQALYPIAYGIKMAFKKANVDGSLHATIDDYVIPPLAGFWTINSKAKQSGTWTKKDLVYQLQLVIPDQVPEEFIKRQMELAVNKNRNRKYIHDVYLSAVPKAQVAHILHVGPYDTEGASFKTLESFISRQGYERTSKNHREIYLGDVRRAVPARLRTILEVEIQPS